MDFETYEILKRAVTSKYKPKLIYNKRVDATHRKLDLVFIDGYYKDREERQEKKRLEFEARNKKRGGTGDDSDSRGNSDNDSVNGSRVNGDSDVNGGNRSSGGRRSRRLDKPTLCDLRVYSDKGKYVNEYWNKKEIMSKMTVII
jgi:hypothetical protein